MAGCTQLYWIAPLWALHTTESFRWCPPCEHLWQGQRACSGCPQGLTECRWHYEACVAPAKEHHLLVRPVQQQGQNPPWVSPYPCNHSGLDWRLPGCGSWGHENLIGMPSSSTSTGINSNTLGLGQGNPRHPWSRTTIKSSRAKVSASRPQSCHPSALHSGHFGSPSGVGRLSGHLHATPANVSDGVAGSCCCWGCWWRTSKEYQSGSCQLLLSATWWPWASP